MSLPDTAEEYLILGDATAIPAIARLLEELDPNSRGRALISIPTADCAYDLQAPESVSVEWLPAQGGGASLLDRLQQIPELEQNVFVWVAGEQSEVQAIRRYLVSDRGIDKDAISFTGYWKASGDSH